MRLPHNPAAVVFDMDGLLFDTETLYQEAIQLAAAEGGHEVAADIFKRMVGVPWAQSRTMLLSHFGEAFPVDEFQETWVRHFWVIAETRLALKPGALELFDTLDQLYIWPRVCDGVVPTASHDRDGDSGVHTPRLAKIVRQLLNLFPRRFSSWPHNRAHRIP